MQNLFAVDNHRLNFGDYEAKDKQKAELEHDGDLYKLKSYKEITRLTRNDILIYESVPGTRVSNFYITDDAISFDVIGQAGASIILGVEDKTNFALSIDDIAYDSTSYIAPGKLNINVDFADGKAVHVIVKKNPMV